MRVNAWTPLWIRIKLCKYCDFWKSQDHLISRVNYSVWSISVFHVFLFTSCVKFMRISYFGKRFSSCFVFCCYFFFFSLLWICLSTLIFGRCIHSVYLVLVGTYYYSIWEWSSRWSFSLAYSRSLCKLNLSACHGDMFLYLFFFPRIFNTNMCVLYCSHIQFLFVSKFCGEFFFFFFWMWSVEWERKNYKIMWCCYKGIKETCAPFHMKIGEIRTDFFFG